MPPPGPQERILSAVLGLLEEEGVDGVSTRAVGSRANVQAPAIYRLFGDKKGLLEAAVERGYAQWVADKGERSLPADPVEALRVGWDDAVEFGLGHPAMYRIASSRTTRSSALSDGADLLRAKVERAAAAGRLRVGQSEAVTLMQATCRGVILSLLDSGSGTENARALSTLARESVISAITADTHDDRDPTVATTATTLRALLPSAEQLSPAEKALMADWLDRLAAAGHEGRPAG